MQDKDLDDFLQKVEADDNRQRKLENRHRAELETRRNGASTPREDSLLDISDMSNLMMVVDDSSVSSAAVSPVGYRVRKNVGSPRGYRDGGESKDVINQRSDDSDDDDDDVNGDIDRPENGNLTSVVAESSPKRNHARAKIGNGGQSMKIEDQRVLHDEISKHENSEATDSTESKSVPLKKFPARGKPREERVKIRGSFEIDMEAPLLPPRTVTSGRQRKEKLTGSSSGILPPSLPQKGKRFRSGPAEEKVKPPVPRHIPALPSRSNKPVYNNNSNSDSDDNKDNTSDTEAVNSMQSKATDSIPPLIDLDDDGDDTPKSNSSLPSKNAKELPPARKSIIVAGTHGSKGPESASLRAEPHNSKRKKPEVPKKSRQVVQKLSRRSTLQTDSIDKLSATVNDHHSTSDETSQAKPHPPSVPPKKPGLFALRETKSQPLPLSTKKFGKFEDRETTTDSSKPATKPLGPPAVPKKKPTVSEEFALRVSGTTKEGKCSDSSKLKPVTKSKTAPTIPTKKVSLRMLRSDKGNPAVVTGKTTHINNALEAVLQLRNQQAVASGKTPVTSGTSRTQSSPTTPRASSFGSHVTDIRGSPSSPALVHLNKGRARGPKRKLPTRIV